MVQAPDGKQCEFPFGQACLKCDCFPNVKFHGFWKLKRKQNLTWSETCAYKNLLLLNSWCIPGALMCKLHFEIAGWHHLWASLAHTSTAPIDLASLPSSSQISLRLFPCSTWGRDARGCRGARQHPAYSSCPQLTLVLAKLVKCNQPRQALGR